MVHEQLCSLEQLMSSGYGRPNPRHGLQLLFWFANHCVVCELVDFVVIMKLVSDCQPERGSCGFHWFGNAEELLPVLKRSRKSNSKKQAVYFEVGNLNTETYSGSANLPEYVRENYRLHGNQGTYNIDRIIIGYQMRTRVVETVYVTEHDRSSSGRFRSDRTYQISAELIHALQSPVLDIDTFLIRMGYFLPMWGLNGNDNEEINYPEPAEQQMLHTYNGWTATTGQNYDSGFLSDIFQQQLDAYTSPFSYDQQVNYTDNVTQDNSGLMAVCREMQHPHRSQYYPPPEWYQPYEVFNEEAKKRRGGGGCSLVKLLLGVGAFVGAFCLAAKCFSWLRSWFKVSPDESIVKMIPWRPAIYKHTHIMLDYVY